MLASAPASARSLARSYLPSFLLARSCLCSGRHGLSGRIARSGPTPAIYILAVPPSSAFPPSSTHLSLYATRRDSSRRHRRVDEDLPPPTLVLRGSSVLHPCVCSWRHHTRLSPSPAPLSFTSQSYSRPSLPLGPRQVLPCHLSVARFLLLTTSSAAQDESQFIRRWLLVDCSCSGTPTSRHCSTRMASTWPACCS